MPRTILAHLNITLQDNDHRTAAQVEEVLEAVIEVGTEGAPEEIVPFDISITLVEEI